MSDAIHTERIRREPPAFLRASVVASLEITPRMRRIELAGDDLAGFTVDEPASSVRVLLPPSDGSPLVLPTWNGNEFLLDDGTRPPIRTLTPLRVTPATGSFAVEVVVHEGGAASTWASSAQPGDEVMVSGPGRGYDVDPDAAAYLLAGDETALPALGQILDDIAGDVPVEVIVEVGDDSARRDELEASAGGRAGAGVVHWVPASSSRPGDALVDAVVGRSLAPGTKVWAAGEAAAMQRLRTHFYEACGLTRADAMVRGYWKHGRAASS